MSDEDEREVNCQHVVVDHHQRRLSEIKLELQGLMRQKKKYDVEKLTQNGEFLQDEITALNISIMDMNKVIINQTLTKKRLQIQITNLRSRSQVRFTNLAIALRDKLRYEVELKKQDKTEEYRELARKHIQRINNALPTLKEEDEYKVQIKKAEDEQQAATLKRKKLQENFEANLHKQAEIKKLLSENSEKLPMIEAAIDNLLIDRKRLLLLSNSSSSNGKKQRYRLPPNQSQLIDIQTSIRTLDVLEKECFEREKQQCINQLDNVNTLITYFQDKMTEHGLQMTPSFGELPSPLQHPLTFDDQTTILSSYMYEQDSPDILLHKQMSNEPMTAVAMKLPRNFAPLNLQSSGAIEIIHSPFRDGNEIEYKKELSFDIVNKYGGQPKKSPASQKNQRKQRKHFAVSHRPQMIALYNNARSSSESSDTLPSMPMHEYDLLPAIKALESFKQSLEFYSLELSKRQTFCSTISIDEQQIENEDSALDTFSEASSLIYSTNKPEQSTTPPLMNNNIFEIASLSSSDERKTMISSSSDHNDIHLQSSFDALTSQLKPLTIETIHIDRQVSDEGYRSVRNEQKHGSSTHHSSPLLTRSTSYDCTEKVDRWLSTATTPTLSSSVPISMTYFHIDNADFRSAELDDDEEFLSK